MKLIFKISVLSVLILILAYALGPSVTFNPVNNKPEVLDISIDSIEQYVKQQEMNKDIKNDNEARIIWADTHLKTPYAFVYLHGFSASIGEANPIMDNLIDKYKFNAYLSRLAGHGLKDEDAMASLTPAAWIDSAKKAIAIGKVLGEKVIIVSTSTGSTLATYLAANDPAISHLIMMSPNFDLYDTNSRLISRPWGKQILKFISKGDYHYWNITNAYVNQYWNTKKRIEGLIALRNLLDQTMTDSIFRQIDIPYFIAYYFKDEDEKDEVISIDAIKKFEQLSATPSGKKWVQSYADAHSHVIGCACLNPNWENVQDGIFGFLDEQLN